MSTKTVEFKGRATVTLDQTKRRLKYGISDYLLSFIPGPIWLPKYQPRWLVGDIISGLTLGVMIVPQALAYSRLAGISVQHGLFSAFAGHLVYAFLGTSREISIGPLAVPGILIAKTILKLKDFSNEYTPEQIGSSLALLFGIVCIGFGIFRLGVILEFIPNAVIVGFTTGLALSILLSQFAPMMGITLQGHHKNTLEHIEKTFMGITNLNWENMIFGIVSLLFLFGMRFLASKLGKKHPIISHIAIAANAILVIVATLISWTLFKFVPKFPLSIIKVVPSGFSKVGPPTVDLKLWSRLILHVPGIFLIIVLESSAIAKGFSRKGGYEMAPSQEVFALGVCNVVIPFFSGFPSGGAVSRAALFDRSGVKTPLAGIVVSLIVLASFLFLTPLFYYIPNPTLAAIIFRAGLSLFPSLATLRRFWNAHPIDLAQCLIASIATFLFGAEIGIGSAVGTAFLFLLYRLARPQILELHESIDIPNMYVEKTSYLANKPLPPGILAFRVQESIIFPNISHIVDQIVYKCLLQTRPFQQAAKREIWSLDIFTKAQNIRNAHAKIMRITDFDPEKLPALQGVIIDLSAVNWVDSSGLRGLEDLMRQLVSYAGPDFKCFLVSTNIKVISCLIRTGIGYISKRPPPPLSIIENPTDSPLESRNSLILEGHLGPSNDDCLVIPATGFPIYPSLSTALDAILLSV